MNNKMIKKIIIHEKEFIEKVLKKSIPINEPIEYNKIPYHRYIEYIIHMIEENVNNKIPILHESSEFLKKQQQGYENIYIFNSTTNKEDDAILRLSMLEVKSFEPKNKEIKTYNDFQDKKEVIFSQINSKGDCISKIQEALNDITKNKTKSSYREGENKTIMRFLLPACANKSNYKNKTIRNDFLEHIKGKLNLNVNVGTTDKLFLDLERLIENQKLSINSLGTVITDLKKEEKFIENIKLDDYDEIEEITCIIVKVKENNYKPIIKAIVDYNVKKEMNEQ